MTPRIAAYLAWSTLLCVAGVHSQELEPGVQTSSSAAPVGHDAAKGKPAPKAAAVPAPSAAAPAQPAAAVGARSAAAKSSDRIQLDTTEISGNRELPKVMYVVPWRRADPGDFAGRPPNSLLDEALTPVDRDVFRRQNRYYSEVQGQSQANKSQGDATTGGAATPAAKDEK